MDKKQVLIKASWISIIGNSLLSVLKVVAGIFTGSLAVLSDGIDSATDVVISLVMIFTAKIMNKPPNQKYVYGYEKAEGVATKILSLIIFFAGAQMLVSSVQSIFDYNEKVLPGKLAIGVTVISIGGKLLLSWYQNRQGKRINSPMLIANSVNMRNDVLISVGVLVGLVFTFVLNLPVLDSVAGLVISLFIIWSSVKIFLESNVELLDGVKDENVYNRIFEAVDMVPEAHNPHRARIRTIGNLYMIALDIEVDGNITLNQAHHIAHEVEERIIQTVENIYDIVVHVEPLGKEHPAEKFGIDRKWIKSDFQITKHK
ncbi:MAG: cation diffusion facilitator family transporter [Mariniphaga sp.]